MAFDHIVFCKKKEARQKCQDHQIIATHTLQHYFIIDNHSDLLDYITQSPSKNFYEYIPPGTPVNMYFDIEIYKNDQDQEHESKDPMYFDNPLKIITMIKNCVNGLGLLKEYTKKWIILESHNQDKKSFHIIVRLTDSEGKEWYFKDFLELKQLYNLFNFGKYRSGKNSSEIIDSRVYRDGLFRTIHSSKEGESRPLVKSDISDEFHEIDSFVTYTRNRNIIPKLNAKLKKEIEASVQVLECELDDITISLIKNTICQLYNADISLLGEPFIETNKKCIVVPSLIKMCPFMKREHKSNHSYFVIDNYSIKQKCHDSDCASQKYMERKVNSLEQSLLLNLKKYLDISPDNINKIDNAIQDTTTFLQKFDNDIQTVTYNQVDNTFFTSASESCVLNLRGHCQVCNTVHVVTRNGYYLECVNCKSRVPTTGYLPVELTVNAFFMQINIQTNITIQDPNTLLNTDIILDAEIFNDDEFTTLLCNALHGNKIAKLGDVFYKLNQDFAYDKVWYYFDGQFWKEDPEGCVLKNTIMDVLTECLNKIIVFYKDQPDTEKLLASLDGLIILLNTPRTLNNIEQMIRIHFYTLEFKSILNSKTYLLPFTNGVYDFKQDKFRVIEKLDYVQTFLNYDYDPLVPTDVVMDFISKILPNPAIRHYFLVHLSKCLNGEETNEYFNILNGSGSNGKSQIINLIVETLGKFSYKPDISMITQRRADSSAATPQKAGLYNVRFAYFTEPSSDDKFNGGLFKELTGNEDILSRNLYENQFTFRNRAKFYLACNQIPEIDADDAIQRRIVIIEFNSKFVINPTNPNEYEIDFDIPNKIKEDPIYKKGFMNLLLQYYPIKVKETPMPPEVQYASKEYIQDNSIVHCWCEEHIIRDDNNVLQDKDMYQLFRIDNKSFKLIVFRNQVKTFFEKKYNTTKKNYTEDNTRKKGYKGFNIRE